MSDAASSGRDEVDVSLFVACYNEAHHIADTLDKVLLAVDEVGCSYEIIVVDDASQDASDEIVRAYQAAHPERPIRLVVKPHNVGLARNYFDTAQLARGRYYRLVCGDDVEPVETLVAVLRQLGRADLVIPYHEACEGKPASRLALSRGYTRLVNSITGYDVRYYNGMALHLRENVLRGRAAADRGFAFQADLLARVLDEGIDYVQIPVEAFHRDGNSNALSPRNFFSVARLLGDLALRRARRPLSRPMPRSIGSVAWSGGDFGDAAARRPLP